jgi:hypothetical protein
MSSKKSTEEKAKAEITSKAKLKEYLLNIRDKMTEGVSAPIYSLTAMNYVLNLPKIYTLLDEANKEIARDIWLRIKQAGFKIKNPSLLFAEDEI